MTDMFQHTGPRDVLVVLTLG